MCLYYNKQLSDKFKKRKIKKFYVYKFLELKNELLKSPYESLHRRKVTKWLPGYIESNRKSSYISSTEIRNFEIKKGIHVYLNRKDALNTCDDHCVVLKLEVNLKDFVAKNNNDIAVFTKVKLSKEEYQRVLKVRQRK